MFRKFSLFCLVFFAQMLPAQSPRLESIGIREGLSQGFVSSIIQDREGFIWVGTKNGLNRFDGHTFQVFTHQLEDPFSLSNDQIWAIEEYRDFLLIATGTGVLDIFDKKTQRFFHLPLIQEKTLKSPYTTDVFVDKQQNIWALTGEFEGSRQVCVIPLPLDFWTDLPKTTESQLHIEPRFLPNDKVFSILPDKVLSTVYFNTPESVFAINTKTLESSQVNWPYGTRPVKIQIDSEGRLWAGLDHWLSCYDGNTYQDFILDFRLDQFLGFAGPALGLFRSQKELMAVPMQSIRSAAKSDLGANVWKIPCSDAVNCHISDASGNLWIGLNGNGILKLSPDFRQVKHLFPGNSIYGSVFSSADGMVIAMVPPKALFYPETKSSAVARVLQQYRSQMNGLWRQCADKEGNIWLYAAMISTPKLIKIKPDGTQSAYDVPFGLKKPGNLMADNDGMIWMAMGRALMGFDPVQERWQVHSLEQIFPYAPEIYGLARSADGTVWVGTQGGLLEAKPDGIGSFLFTLHGIETGALRHNAVSCLLVDAGNPNLLWIATKGGGLSRLDLNARRFTHFYSRDGLPNDVLYGILPDAQGNLWMSSNKGIIRYNPVTGVLRNFTEADGMQSDEFNTWAYALGPEGTLMFGGIKGLNLISPEQFKDNPYLPRVLLTGLSLNNHAVGVGDSTGVLKQAIEFTESIRLSYAQRSITLSFAALEFTTSIKNRFRWILEGAENTWHQETTERSATYLNLQPGTYTFKVMAANGDGVWNPNPATLIITVLPPWYRSIWAYLLYGLLLGALIYGYLRFRLSQLRLQQQLELEHLNAARLKELDKFKSRVFTNVSHEFRTPLTVILGMAEQLEQQYKSSPPSAETSHKSKPVELIKRNGQNLLRLINQILDLAKLENNALKINNVQGDVLAFVRYVAESMHSLASIKNILLQVESHVAGGKIMMDYDPERLLHILHNLLSNAIKFTPAGGRVWLRVALFENKQGVKNWMQITVADTGAGISPEALPHVFERFFQADNQQHPGVGGSGIGLSLTHELVKLMGGEISVESELGKGTVFMVRLPVSNLAALEAVADSPPPVTADTPRPFPLQNASLPTLLLIEDNPDVVDYLSVCLGEYYQLDYAYNGRSGIDRALETIPDLIISDVMMPEKDGFEVCAFLKNDERSSHIPIVLLTAKAAVEDRIAGLRRGADAYLAKPFHPEELRAVLANLLELRQKLQARYFSDRMMGDWSIGDQWIGVQPGGLHDSQFTNHQSPINQSPDIEDVFLQKLRIAVESRLGEPDLSVDEISRMVGMSYPVVHRKVTAITGRSLTLFVRAIRLQKAGLLLADPALSISEVAYQTGFNDPKFFSRVFSEAFGMPPTAFRQNLGK